MPSLAIQAALNQKSSSQAAAASSPQEPSLLIHDVVQLQEGYARTRVLRAVGPAQFSTRDIARSNTKSSEIMQGFVQRCSLSTRPT